MRHDDPLAAFVRDALARGRPRDEVGAALAGAGWAPAEVAEALASWADGGALPPVPRPRAGVSAREGFWYGLLFLALAVTAWHLGSLAFAVVDLTVTDPARLDGDGWEGGWRRDSVRWSVAALLVFTPVSLILHARLEREARADPGRRRSGVRQSLGHLTLLVTALVLLSDLLAVVYAALSGDLTLRFALKAVAVAVIAVVVLAVIRDMTRGAADAR